MNFHTDERVTLLNPIPIHHAGEHGTVHGTYGHWIGVCFDTQPHFIRYVEPIDIARIPTNDVENITQAAEAAVLHTIRDAWDIDTPCSWPECDGLAVWWWEHTCGHIIYRCEPHRAAQDHRMERYEATHPYQTWRCAACNTNSPSPIPWRAL